MANTPTSSGQSADPLGGDTAFEILGVSEADTIDTIEKKKDELLQEWHLKMNDALSNNNKDEYNDALEAIETIEDAWEWVEGNHTPKIADQPVEIEVLTTDPVVEDTVTVRVTSKGTEDAVETLVHATDDKDLSERERTDSETGEAQFTFQQKRVVQFTAKTTENYDDASTAEEIDRKEKKLEFDDLPNSEEKGEAVDIGVKADGEMVDASVTIDDDKLGNTNQGYLQKTFNTIDTFEVEASKTADDKYRYQNAKDSITITEEQVELEVTVEGNDFKYDDEVTVHVNEDDTGAPVPDATVTIGSKTETTNDKGVAKLPVKEVGKSVKVEATKTAKQDEERTYKKDYADIEVTRKQGDLFIDDITGKLMENCTITVHVIDGEKDPLPDARVTTDWNHDTSTNDQGEACLDLNDTGRMEITVQKKTETTDYGEDKDYVSIGEYTRKITIEVSDNVLAPGDTITVTVKGEQNNGIQGATVKTTEQRGESWQTGPDGTVSFPVVNKETITKIIATTDDGSEAEQSVSVLS